MLQIQKIRYVIRNWLLKIIFHLFLKWQKSKITKINNVLVDNAEELDIVMSIYNVIEYSKNYSETTRNFWNIYRDGPNSGAVGDINYSIKVSKSFDYKTSITGELEGNITKKEVQIAVQLKHLSNFWKTLDIPLINCAKNFILTWSEYCVITSKATRYADPYADPAVAEINNWAGATFKTTDTKLYAQ